MTSLLQQLLHVPSPVVLAVIAALVFGEAAVFLGFVLPGETAVLIGGFLASTGKLSVYLLAAVVVAAAIIGDSVGYEVGRHLGPRILRVRLLRGRQEGIARAQQFLARRGGAAVFLGRWIALFRALMPALAGTARMPYPTFLVWNALGGVTWGVTVVVLGYLAGASYKKIEGTLGTWAAVAVAGLVVVGLIVWRVRRHLLERRGR